MKDLRQFLSRVFHRASPTENSGIEGTDHETGEKLLQYFMLCVLLVLCFLLPGAGAGKKAKESARQSAQQKNSSGLNAEDSADQKPAAGGTEDGGEGKGTIVIDPGHGGDDPGMIGPSGINEKVLNLVYAEKLKELLEARGYKIVMTRETENGLYDEDQPNKKAQDMERRVKIIEESDPLLTVSIHQNSYPDASVSGPQVFYFQHSAKAEKLAASIQNALNTELEIERPREQKGNTSYYILKRSSSVTVIVECGFLTNPQEEEKLQQEEYQDRTARAICDGVLAYLEDLPLASLQMM